MVLYKSLCTTFKVSARHSKTIVNDLRLWHLELHAFGVNCLFNCWLDEIQQTGYLNLLLHFKCNQTLYKITETQINKILTKYKGGLSILILLLRN